MKNFWFWLRYRPSETPYIYEPSKITLNKVSYLPTQYFIDSSTSKVFTDCEFDVDVGGSLLHQDIARSCTLYLTDDFKVRISIYLNYVEYQKFNQDLRNEVGDCMRFCISDPTNLEEHSKNLLHGSNRHNTFVKDIADFQLSASCT